MPEVIGAEHPEGRGLYRSSGNEWIPDQVGDDSGIGSGVWLSNFDC
ncbi:hypothetical protein [Roseibium sp. MMSF_3247]|nr:hypothetical protein [Roseibium sp. MMSF_3247]